MTIAAAIVRPPKPWTMPMPRPSFRATTTAVRAEGIALVQQLRAVAFGEAVGREQVLRHVGVEAGAEDAEVAFDREGERGRQEGAERDGGSSTQRLSPALDPPAKVDRRDDRQQRDQHGRDTPFSPIRTVAQEIAQTSARPTAGESQDQRLHPAECNRRLSEDERGDADGQRGGIGRDHRTREPK